MAAGLLIGTVLVNWPGGDERLTPRLFGGPQRIEAVGADEGGLAGGQPPLSTGAESAEPSAPPTAAEQPAPGETAPPTADGTETASAAELNEQGFALVQAGRYEEAIPILQRAVESFPAGTSDINYAYALFNLGNALRLAGRPEEAIPILEQRLQIPNQLATVERELELARAAAGVGDGGEGSGKKEKKEKKDEGERTA